MAASTGFFSYENTFEYSLDAILITEGNFIYLYGHHIFNV